MTTLTYDDVENAEMSLEEAKTAYLLGSGWKRTCDVPGSLWLWEKEIRGRVVLVDEGSALHIQGEIEADSREGERS